MQARKHASERSTLALKPRAEVTRSPKQGYQWPHKKDSCPSKNFLKQPAFLSETNSKFHYIVGTLPSSILQYIRPPDSHLLNQVFNCQNIKQHTNKIQRQSNYHE